MRLHNPLSQALVRVVLLFAAVSTGYAAEKSPAKEVTFRLTADPATLDWNLAQTSHETYIVMNIMEGLVEPGPDSKPRPALAEKWEISKDGRAYTFHIRKDAKWSDGRDLRAQDFVDSWIRLLDPDTGSAYANYLFEVENAEAFHKGKVKNPARVGVKAVGPHELRVRLRRVVPYFLHMPTFWVTFPVRADLIEKHGKEWTAPGKIATVGPYLLKEWKKGKSIVLTRNPDYHGADDVLLDKATARIIPDDTRAREIFKKGEIDFLLDATTADLLEAKMGDTSRPSQRIRVGQYPYLATYYLAFNLHKGPLRDVNLRKALALAIDPSKIPGLLQGGQVPARGWIPPGIDGHGSENRLKGSLYDARAALARAGYTEAQGLPTLQLLSEKFDGAEILAEHIGEALRERLGVSVETEIATPAEYLEARKKGEAHLYVGHWGADFPDPANFFDVWAPDAGTNFLDWKDGKYGKAVERGRSTLDQKKRLKAYDAAEKILLRGEVVLLPLFYKQTAALLSSRIDDLEISPLNYLFLKNVRLR